MKAPTSCPAALVGMLVLALTMPARGQVAISEVLFDPVGVNTGAQLVEIHNYGETEFNLGDPGYWLYFPPAQWQFPPGVVLPPGGTLTVHIKRPGQATETELFTGVAGMRDLAREDAISLFRSNLFGDPEEIVDFVQWGGFGNGGEEVAASARIWGAFSYVHTSALREGSTLAYDGEGDTAEDWCVDGTPTLGAPNDTCSTSYARSPVVLNEVGYARVGDAEYHPAVELVNAGDVLENLGGKWLLLGAEHTFQFPLDTADTLVGPGELVVVHLGVDGTGGEREFYTGAGTFRDLEAVDSLSFQSAQQTGDATTLLDFLQWGAPGSTQEPPAVEAGIWNAGGFVDVSDRTSYGSLVSLGEGIGAARWTVDNTGTIGLPNDAPPVTSLVINEILVDPAGTDPGQQVLELKNILGDESLPVGGVTICAEDAASAGNLVCFSVPDGVSVPPEGFLLVNLNSTLPDEEGVVHTGPFPELDPVGGVLLLYLTPNVSSVDNLLDYVRWGTGSLTWEDTADQVGMWPGDEAISVAAVTDSSSIAYLGGGEGPAFYRVDSTPSPGEENEEPQRDEPFRRGDCNDDGIMDISDAIMSFGFMFLGERGPLCDDACDSNDDGALDISDPVFSLNYLFLSGSQPAAPGPLECGLESGFPDGLSCDSFLSCN